MDREELHATLASEDTGVVIMPGGIAELFLSERHRERLYLRKRRGFVKMAQELQMPIVPVYVFGQTRLFDQLAAGNSWAARLSRYFKASLTLFWGQYFLPIPYSGVKLTVAIGRPIPGFFFFF